MAGYECSLCQGQEQATLLITPLTGGETMAVGESCMAVAFTGMLAGHLQIDPETVWDAIVAAQELAAREHPDGTPKDEAGPGAVAGPGAEAGPGAGPPPGARPRARPRATATGPGRRPRSARTGGQQ